MKTQLATELKNSPRLRLGIACIASILWGYFIIESQEKHTALQEQLARLNSEIGRASQHASRSEWLDRAEQAKALLLTQQTRMWQNATLGQAQAAWQDWLKRQLSDAEINNPQIKVAERDPHSAATPDESAAALPEHCQPMRAKIAFDFNDKKLATLLKQLASAGKLVNIESMDIQRPRVEMVLVAYHLDRETR